MMNVVTHDGVFHSDDVFAGALVRRLWPEAAIVRTRKPELIALADLAFDVGAGMYDHHQPGGNGVRGNGVPYASFGLLWRAYGWSACGDDQKIADEVDRQLVQAVDAHDNGYVLATPLYDDAKQYTVSHLISNMNPSWDEEQDFDARYHQAVALAALILDRVIVRARGVIRAKSEVRQAIADAIDPRVVVLPYFVPWQEALCEQSKDALLIVYPSVGTWCVRVVPVTPGQPGARMPLPFAWAGLDGEALRELTGVIDATFAHRGRFIAGATTRNGALALAKLALGE